MWAAVPEERHGSVLEGAAAVLDQVREPDGLSRLRQVVRYTTARLPR
jgi:hypothetical protein